MRLYFCLLPLLIYALTASATDQSQTYIVQAVISGDELTLTNDQTLRLEGVKQPFAETGNWRDQARQILTNLTSGHELTVEDASVDRYGRLSGQAYVSDAQGHKIWLQGELLRLGLAFVHPPLRDEARLDDMRATEASARRARTGIWGDPAYDDAPSGDLSPQSGRFAFVSGVVHDTARVKNIVYLNFGEDWKTNLTVMIAAHDLRAFRKADIDPLELTGKKIRVRGWLKHNYGPVIAVTTPAQIEILETH